MREEVFCFILNHSGDTGVYSFSFFFFPSSRVALQCCVSFCSTAVWISHIYVYNPPSWTSLPAQPTCPGPHRTLSWAPCPLQQVPTSHLFYTWQCADINPNLPVHPVFPPPMSTCLYPRSDRYPCLSIGLSVSLSRFHIHALIFDICFSLSDLLYSVYQTLGMSLSIFLHLFNSLYWNSLSFQIVVLEKTVESPLDSKEVNPKGNQPWVFIGRTDAEAEAPVLWPPDVKNWLIGKDPELGKDEGRRRKERQRMRWYKGWDGWMTSPTQWTWVWANSGRQWSTRKPGMLQSMGSQRVGHYLATEQQQYWNSPRSCYAILIFFSPQIFLHTFSCIQ